MKHSWLVMVACLVPVTTRAEPEAGIAFKGGANASTSAGDASANRYGFTGGLAASLQWPFAAKFSLAGQTELLYTPRGPEVVFEGEYLGKFRLHYFDVTVAARPEVRLGPTSVYLLLGGGLNLLLRANKESALGAKQDITDDLRRFDVSLLAGAGVALHLPSGGTGPFRLGAVFLEARHDHGLLPADAVNDGLKNRASSVMLGLSLTMSSGRTVPPPRPPVQSDSLPAAAVGSF